MTQFSYTITDEAGIHARPAGLLVKAMQSFPCDIQLTRGEKTIDAKKLFALMGMAVKAGETVTITAQGEQEEEAIATAKAFLEENL